MARERFCPKCGEDVTDSYELCGGFGTVKGTWYCDACELPLPEDDHDD